MRRTQRKTATEVDAPDFGFSDVMTLPEPQMNTHRRVFEALGRKWPVTLKAIRKGASAEDYYKVASLMDSSGKKPQPINISLPGGGTVEISNEGYLTSLHFLASLTVKPAFGVEEWAIFGHKVGAECMEELFAFASEINGLDTVALQKQLDEGKNA